MSKEPARIIQYEKVQKCHMIVVAVSWRLGLSNVVREHGEEKEGEKEGGLPGKKGKRGGWLNLSP